ncbi:hypothetical protein [Fodinibius sediminis]|uniref:Uncharacterized protein n=1 Tax=Fodinibius sediminis TaxID=1214077 RepID=A0A521EMX6_9BACT|nr:hypothetical protein [Fodinibius sediminis]SMO85252.1 hypothetical protein SAMN06265218_11766 [Fodinibius sediminis]
MNLSLISSFAIGSVLMLSLVKVNLSLVESSMDSMNDQIAKVNIDNISTVLSSDIRKIGYRKSGSSLLEATPQKLTFLGDLEDDGVVDQVTWEWDQTQAVTETRNPADYVLTRTVNGHSTDIKLGVIKFGFQYYDDHNVPTTVLDDIRRVKAVLVSESAEPVGDDYMKAAWEKTFVPLSIAN